MIVGLIPNKLIPSEEISLLLDLLACKGFTFRNIYQKDLKFLLD